MLSTSFISNPAKPKSRLPDFILIGAMKSGSTTLYHDLINHPDLFCAEKETGCLHKASAVDCYADAFRNASASQLCGEFVTTYAMLPESTRALDRAKAILPKETKFIYLIREPVSRTLSHHRHMANWHGSDRMSNDFNAELQRRPELIEYSCYAKQLRPWLTAFGKPNFYVIEFNDYVSNRRVTINNVTNFLGVRSIPREIDASKAYNKSEGKPLSTQFWRRVLQSKIYRKSIRPLTSQKSRDRFKELLFPKSADSIVRPTETSIKTLLSVFETEIEDLQALLEHPSPMWDIQAMRQKYIGNGFTCGGS